MKKILFAAIAALAGYGLSGCATHGYYGYGYDYGYGSTCPRGYYPSGTGRCSSSYQSNSGYYRPFDYYGRDRSYYDDRPYNWNDSYDDDYRYRYRDRVQSGGGDWYDRRRAGLPDDSDYDRNDDRQYRTIERRQQRRGSNEYRTVERRERRDRDRD